MTQATGKLGQILLTNVRIAFAHGLWKADTVQGQGRPAFSASFLFPPNHPDVPKIQQALLEVARQKWGQQGDQVYQALAASGRICLRDGNSKPDVEGYPGNYFISARTPTRPLVIDQNRAPLDQTSGKPYSGCYVNVRLNIWAQQNQHGRRINAQLAGVQFAKDGEPFSGGGSADAEEFGEVEQSAQAGAEFGSTFGVPAPAGGDPLFGAPQQPGVGTVVDPAQTAVIAPQGVQQGQAPQQPPWPPQGVQQGQAPQQPQGPQPAPWPPQPPWPPQQ